MNLYEPTEEQIRKWDEWVKERPECVRVVAERFKPWKLYRMKAGHRVYLASFCEDGTMTVFVTGRFNFVAFDRRVFGVNPDDLTECDLPGPGEVTGSMNLSIPEAKALHKAIKVSEN